MVNIIVNADPRYNVNKEGIKAVVSRVLTRLRISGKIELGVNVIGDRKMSYLLL